MRAQFARVHRLGEEAVDLRLVDEIGDEIGIGLLRHQDRENLGTLILQRPEELDEVVLARGEVGDDRGDLVAVQELRGLRHRGGDLDVRSTGKQPLETLGEGLTRIDDEQGPGAARRVGDERGGGRDFRGESGGLGERGANLVVVPGLLHEAEDFTLVDRSHCRGEVRVPGEQQPHRVG